MKYPLHIRKVSRLFWPIMLLTALLVVISSRVLSPSPVLAQTPPAYDVPVCFMETTSGQMLNLERLCGKGSGNIKKRPSVPILSSLLQANANLEWIRNNPSASIANAPSPYNSQGAAEFNKVLYGD